MKKTAKLISAMSVIATVICLFVFITSAQETATKTTPEIISSNICYEGNFSIVLAVKADTVSGGSVSVTFTGEDGKHYTDTESTTTKISPNGATEPVECYVLKSPGIAAGDMDEFYTYVATDASGNVSEEGRISVAEYFYTRLFENGIINATADDKENYDYRDFYLSALTFGAKAQNILYNLDKDEGNNVTTYVTDLLYANIPGYSFDGKYETDLIENKNTEVTLPGTTRYVVTKYTKENYAKTEAYVWGGESIIIDAHTVVRASIGGGIYYNYKNAMGTRIDGDDLLNKLHDKPDSAYGTALIENEELVYSSKGGYSTLSWSHNSNAVGLTSPAMIFEADVSFDLNGTGEVGSVRLFGNGKELSLNMQFYQDLVYISHNGSLGVQLNRGEKCNLRIEIDYNNNTVAYYVNGILSTAETGLNFAESDSTKTVFGFSSTSGEGSIMTFDNVYMGFAEATDKETIINSRWNKLEKEINTAGYNGAETVSALKGLYSLYSGDTVEWLANLYDPSIGGFYYSNSAKETDGYLPDIESTMQALNFMRYSGLIGHPKSIDATFKNNIIDFVKGLQSDSDGYFYHPQWSGLEITDERRGRDQMWALDILSLFGAKPYYTTGGVAGERGDPGVSAASHLVSPLGMNYRSQISRVVACATIDHLKDEASFKAYLDSQDWTDAYETGNRLAAQVTSIRDAGLLNYLIGYLNDKQIKTGVNTGMWDNQSGYKAVNGLFKIATIYQAADVVIPYSTEAANYCIATLDDDLVGDGGTVCWVYNVWYSLDMITSLLENSNDADNIALAGEIRTALRENSVTYINKATEIYQKFRKSDGSFSFNQKSTSSLSQGMPVAVEGTDEGDVNATYISSIGLINRIYSALGYEFVDLYTYHDYVNFMNVINSTEN